MKFIIQLSIKPIFILFGSFYLFACESSDKPHPTYGKVVAVPAEGIVPEREVLPQQWNQPTREQFWFTSQGSRVLPYVWFTWLEQADNTTLFRHSENIERFRYLPEHSSALNPAGLPIGFALDKDASTGDAWFGFTCAACHTAQVDINSRPFLIEGGPTMADFSAFLADMLRALEATLMQNDPEKFDRFARRVLADAYSASLAEELNRDMEDIAASLRDRDNINGLPESYPHDFISYGRIDAFGIIKNASTALALDDLSNHNIVNAPVSYPFLWGTNQSDVVQWNGLLPNDIFLGPLARNAGEVVGAYGGLRVTPAPWWKRWFLMQKNTYRASVNFENLGQLEAWLRDLRSPRWQQAVGLPAIDTALASRGNALYKQACAQCHQQVDREDQGEPYTANMVHVSYVGSDELMAKNAIDHIARTLQLEGVKKAIYAGEKFGSSAVAIEFPINGTFGLMLNEPFKVYRAADQSKRKSVRAGKPEQPAELATDDVEVRLQSHMADYVDRYKQADCSASRPQAADGLSEEEKRYCYKARPLTGIWATAPYLHNGAVPTLWDLLQVPEQRPLAFGIGNREFDPQKVGFVTEGGLAQFRVKRDDGSVMPGNDNKGHLFGTQLSNDDKWALLEYLKTL